MVGAVVRMGLLPKNMASVASYIPVSRIPFFKKTSIPECIAGVAPFPTLRSGS
jgi:hypothetical protein